MLSKKQDRILLLLLKISPDCFEVVIVQTQEQKCIWISLLKQKVLKWTANITAA